MTNKKIDLFGIKIDKITMKEAIEKLTLIIKSEARNNFYVVTPNTDHIVQLQSNTHLQEAYKNAYLVVADGKPVVLASRLLGKPLPETIPGSDLLPELFTQISKNKTLPKVYLFGAAPGVATKAAENIRTHWNGKINIHMKMRTIHRIGCERKFWSTRQHRNPFFWKTVTSLC